VWIRVSSAAKRHGIVLIAVVLIGLVRIPLGDMNSYWNDEILSVYRYGIANDNVVEAIRNLANGSIHPPLYQFILFFWMAVFGDGEVATRALSGLFISVATLFLYAFTVRYWSRAVAGISAIAFNLSYIPFYYSLESRSYALTIMLATISMYVLWTALNRSAGEDRSWRPSSARWWWTAWVLSNLGLAFSHYYNMFFLLAQAFLALAFVIAHVRREHLFRAILFGGLLSLIPPAMFAVIWGRYFLRQFASASGDFAVEDSVSLSPVQLLLNSIVDPGILGGVWVAALVCAMPLILIVGLATSPSLRRAFGDRRKMWALVALVAWMVLPLILTYVTFLASGVERFSDRYFVFSVPPVYPLLVISISALVTFALTRSQHAATVATGVALIVALSLAIPTGIAAALEEKADWRGNTIRTINLVENSDTTVRVIETQFGTGSRANYYFERFSDSIRVDLVLRPLDDRRGLIDRLAPAFDGLRSGDQVVVMFNHLTTDRYPNLLEQLELRSSSILDLTSEGGRGLVVFVFDE
jgi:uncharacterized membrane protein